MVHFHLYKYFYLTYMEFLIVGQNFMTEVRINRGTWCFRVVGRSASSLWTSVKLKFVPWSNMIMRQFRNKWLCNWAFWVHVTKQSNTPINKTFLLCGFLSNGTPSQIPESWNKRYESNHSNSWTLSVEFLAKPLHFFAKEYSSHKYITYIHSSISILIRRTTGQ